MTKKFKIWGNFLGGWGGETPLANVGALIPNSHKSWLKWKRSYMLSFSILRYVSSTKNGKFAILRDFLGLAPNSWSISSKLPGVVSISTLHYFTNLAWNDQKFKIWENFWELEVWNPPNMGALIAKFHESWPKSIWRYIPILSFLRYVVQ